MLVRPSNWPFISSFLVIGLIGGVIGGFAYQDELSSMLECEKGADKAKKEAAQPTERPESPKPEESSPTELTLPSGEDVALDELAPGRPAAIVVMKGAWCPVCQKQLRRLSHQMTKVQFDGAAVFGLTTAEPSKNRRLVGSLGLNFPVLSDASKDLHERFGLWLDQKCHAMPGVIFLNADGEPVKVHKGRYPESPQDSMILRTLQGIGDR